MINENRLKHMLGVARRCYEITKENGMEEEECQNAWLMGLLHDIGYEFADPTEHEKYGEKMIMSFFASKHYKEMLDAIKDHGSSKKQEENPANRYLRILNEADMATQSNGERCTYKERIADAVIRYGEKSECVKECVSLMNILKNSTS